LHSFSDQTFSGKIPKKIPMELLVEEQNLKSEFVLCNLVIGDYNWIESCVDEFSSDLKSKISTDTFKKTIRNLNTLNESYGKIYKSHYLWVAWVVFACLTLLPLPIVLWMSYKNELKMKQFLIAENVAVYEPHGVKWIFKGRGKDLEIQYELDSL
jgi:hypothetical protein